MRVLLDTNVLIDFFGKRAPFYQDAVKLKAAALFGDIEIWATANSFTDVFYILHKTHDSHAIQDMFIASKEILNICSVTSEVILSTAEKKWPDFEDCLIDTCAKNIRADYVLTRDKEGFSFSHTPISSPKEFFLEFEETTGISYAELVKSSA